MSNLFAAYIEYNHGFDILNTLDIFDDIYDRLDIDVCEVVDSLDNLTLEELSHILKKSILVQAVNLAIIPDSWNLEEWFCLDNDFVCTPPKNCDKEEVQNVMNKFNDWSNLDIDIQWK